MTTINSQEDFLRALEENPQWKAAVRALILGEELLQLPALFNAFVIQMTAFVDQMTAFVAEQRQINAEQKQFNERMETFVEEQRQVNAEQRQVNAEQRQVNTEQRQVNAEQRQVNEVLIRRLGRIEGDIGKLRGPFAENAAERNAAAIAAELGLEYVRAVPQQELVGMSRRTASDIPINQLRSFWTADLIMEANDGSSTQYIAVEASYTADKRDTDRAQRNAQFLTEFTGQTARAVIVSVRNDHYVDSQVESGAVYWFQLEDRSSNPE